MHFPRYSSFASIVVPARNEEKLLARCLKSLLEQDYTGNYEIIVVDNDSTDRTREIALSLGAKVVYEKNIGTGSARQCGLLEAKGEIVAFTDADTIVPEHWLSTLVRYLRNNPGIVAVTGPYAFFDAGKVVQALSVMTNCIFINLDNFFRFVTRKGGTIWGSNFAIRRKTALKVGGFNTSIKFLGEDYDLSLRLKGKGKVGLLSTLFVLTSARRLREQGLLCTYSNYILNYFNLLFYHRPLPERLENMPSKLGKAFLNAVPFIHWLRRPVRCADRSLQRVALTFDDGPNEPFTTEILAILKEHDVKATFFVIGENAERFPETCQRLQMEGHIIGNHTYSHPKWLILRRRNSTIQEVQLTQEAIQKAGCKKPILFRPPYGFWTPRFLQTVRRLGLEVITWDNMTDDWEANKKAEDITSAILKKVRPGGIIVLHDGRNGRFNYDRASMVKALPAILSNLKQQGYQFVTMTEMLRTGRENRQPSANGLV